MEPIARDRLKSRKKNPHLFDARSVATDEMSEELSIRVPLVVLVKPVQPILVQYDKQGRQRRDLRMQRIAASRNSSSSSPTVVEFTTVTIREYPITIGDNPASRTGISISIEWDHDSEVTLDVTAYEGERPPRRTGREMIIPPDVRTERLRAMGFTREEIVRKTRPINISRGQRQRTCETLHLESVHLLTENFARHYRNVLTLGQTEKRQRQFLEKFTNTAKKETPEERVETASGSDTDVTSFRSLSGVNRQMSF
jgi:hypothetical protein